MILQDAIDHLQADADSPFALIGNTASLAAIGDRPTVTPAAYLFMGEESASENQRLNSVLQRVEGDLHVVLIARNVTDRTGGAATIEIESLKRAVKPRLIGWQAEEAIQATEYVGGNIVKIRDGEVWYELVFAVAWFERST